MDSGTGLTNAELHGVLEAIGAVGFASVFTLVGLGVIRAAAVSVASGDSSRGGGLALILFGGWFAVLPPLAAFDERGIPGLLVVVSVILLQAIALFASTPATVPDNVSEKQSHPDSNTRQADFAVALPGWPARVGAALPPLVTAICFFVASAGNALAIASPDFLAIVLRSEFLVLHSFPFLAIITLVPVKRLRWRVYQWFLFATFMALYMSFAVARDGGTTGVLAFLSGTVATYTGFIMGKTGTAQLGQLAKRWLVGISVLVVAMAPTGLDGQTPSGAALVAGGCYFLALSVLEVAAFYQRHWSSWPGAVRQRFRPTKTIE